MLNLYCKKNEVLSFSNSHQEIGGDWRLKENKACWSHLAVVDLKGGLQGFLISLRYSNF